MNNTIKTVIITFFSFLSSALGVLYIPVLLMAVCNIIDYITGMMAAPGRGEKISAHKGLAGIIKKIAMWLLVIVGAIIDQLLIYSTDVFGAPMPFRFLVACIVAIWIVCNEIISILENITDIGVALPAFLIPLVKNIRSKTEGLAAESGEVQDENITNRH